MLFFADSGRIYIGRSKDVPTRIRQHIRDAQKDITRPLSNAIRKYGKFDVIVLHTNLSVTQAVVLEILEICNYGADDRRYGYNATKGGDGGTSVTPETRQRMSVAKKGRKCSLKTREAMSLARRGRKCPEGTRQARIELNRASMVPVCAIDAQGVSHEFESINACSRAIGASAGNVLRCLRGERRQANGFQIRPLLIGAAA